MRIAVIADIHHTATPESAFDVRPVVEAFVGRAIESKADILVDLGDRIDDIDRDTDLRLAGELAEIFATFSGPRVHLLGNHDVVNLNVDDHARLFGRHPENQAIDLGEARLIAWHPPVSLDRRVGFPPTSADLDWLLKALAADARPAIIASHVPVSGASMAGNYYFENNADFATYSDHAIVRRAVEDTGRAAIWLAGHVHWNSFTYVGGTFHLTVQSVSERFTTMPEPACAFADLRIENGSARFEVLGRDPLSIEIPFRASGDRRWPAPRPRVTRT